MTKSPWKNTKLTQYEKDIQNSSVSTKVIKYIVKNLPTKKTLAPDGFTGEFCQTFKEQIPILHTLFHQIKDE